MQVQWIGKNVDLALLSEQIEEFFKRKSFVIRRDKRADECRLLAIPPKHSPHDLHESISLKILGNPNDFVVEFGGSEQSHSRIMLGFLSTMIGGGGFLLRDLKSKEILEKLEKEFWAYMEHTVTQLIDSAK